LKIIYFYQYFSTTQGSWGTRVYDFASYWVKQGHEVTVVTGIYAKSDLRSSRLVDDQVHEGIRVKVLNISIDNRQSFLRRIGSFISYATLSSWYALSLPADVVVASSGPITVGIPGLVAKLIKRKPLVFEVRDLWPDGAIELGVLRNPFLKFLSQWFELRCYRNADAIVALSPGMQNAIQKKSGHPMVESVTNSANIGLFATPQQFPVNSPVAAGSYALYSGNIGEVNQVMTLVDCAEELSRHGRSDLNILLIGDGQLRNEVEREKSRRNITNLYLLPLMPKSDLVAYVQHALTALVSLKGSPVLDTSSPNKLFESLAAGVPVIQTTQGWMKEMVECEGVGLSVPAGDASAMAKAIVYLDAHPAERITMRDRASSLASTQFDKDKLAAKMLRFLLSSVKSTFDPISN
jgi:glycosyltransferase involved in cell wall biosynthesis